MTLVDMLECDCRQFASCPQFVTPSPFLRYGLIDGWGSPDIRFRKATDPQKQKNRSFFTEIVPAKWYPLWREGGRASALSALY